MLKSELEHQISEGGENKIKWKRMSDIESKINKELYNHQAEVKLPGIARDHKDKRKEHIMENFLKNPGSAPNAFQSLQTGSQQF